LWWTYLTHPVVAIVLVKFSFFSNTIERSHVIVFENSVSRDSRPQPCYPRRKGEASFALIYPRYSSPSILSSNYRLNRIVAQHVSIVGPKILCPSHLLGITGHLWRPFRICLFIRPRSLGEPINQQDCRTPMQKFVRPSAARLDFSSPLK
jgi:hypothetical protein